MSVNRSDDETNDEFNLFNEGITLEAGWDERADDVNYLSPPVLYAGAANVTVADDGEDEIMFPYYDLRGNIPTDLPKIPKILMEVKSKPCNSRREKEISAMRLNWMYVSMMNPTFSETADPNRKDCEDAIRWIRKRVLAISNQYVSYAKSLCAEECDKSWNLPPGQPRQQGLTSWSDILDTIKTIKSKEDPNWHVVYKLVHGLYEDHTLINHPKKFGRWRLGLINKVVIDQDCKSALNRPLIQHYLGATAKGPVTDVLTKQIMQKFQDIVVAGIRRATLGSCGIKLLVGKPKNPLKWGNIREYCGAQVRWYLASELDSEDTTTTTETTAQELTAGQETIHKDGMGATNPTWPEGTYDRLVYNDAYFANTRALLIEHPNVMAQLLGAMDRPMRDILTLEADIGISTMTN